LLAVFLGLVSLGAGGAAIFTTEVEAGPSVLLLVGLVLIVIAMSGRLPSRLKVGENEAAWEAVAEYVEETVAEAPAEKKFEELARANELAESAPQVGPTVMRYYIYERAGIRAIEEAVDRLPDVRLSNEASLSGGHYGYDIKIGRTDREAVAPCHRPVDAIRHGRTGSWPRR
jgi:hypothetical protein